MLQMAKTADHIDGSQIGDKEFVEKLIRYSVLDCSLCVHVKTRVKDV